jgi:phospho-N-acetylmuramoyl-pentapeptide-transferase
MSTLGFADDYKKAVLKNPRGISGKTKLFWQAVFVTLLIAALSAIPATAPHIRNLMVPMLKTPLFSNICLLCLFVFLFLVFAGSSNAVNLTDGLDGLAAGCTASVAFAFQIMSYVAGHSKLAAYLQIPYIPGAGELSVFCAALLGASLGFLWFNCHPAQVFMGDTGSLAIGGTIATVAIIIKQEIVLFIVGGIFVMEALSVILQVASFKLRKQRIFVCSPLHHHFELKKNGWSETQVTVRFWIISIIFALMGVLFLKIR